VTKLRVITANVNGIRAAVRRGGLEWLAAAKADVICLQEVRATHEQLHEALDGSEFASWEIAHVPAPELGRAGVAILSHKPIAATRGEERTARFPVELRGTGRWLEADIDTNLGRITVVSTYVHSGEVGTVRQDEKMVFLDAMTARMAQLKQRGRLALVCGDINIAHQNVDIKNWKGNLKNSGFLPEERAHLDTWFSSGWVDLGRHHGGEGPGPYTWWSWRGKGFDTDGGWRIDYVLATPPIAKMSTTMTIGKAATYAERWSDHAPVVADFD
jgi:exodeoxyribonuclease III